MNDKTLKRISLAFCFIFLVSLVFQKEAAAGFFDWFKGKKDAAIPNKNVPKIPKGIDPDIIPRALCSDWSYARDHKAECATHYQAYVLGLQSHPNSNFGCHAYFKTSDNKRFEAWAYNHEHKNVDVTCTVLAAAYNAHILIDIGVVPTSEGYPDIAQADIGSLAFVKEGFESYHSLTVDTPPPYSEAACDDPAYALSHQSFCAVHRDAYVVGLQTFPEPSYGYGCKAYFKTLDDKRFEGRAYVSDQVNVDNACTVLASAFLSGASVSVAFVKDDPDVAIFAATYIDGGFDAYQALPVAW